MQETDVCNSNNAMEVVKFSVNRNGSTFMLDEPTQELVEDYYVQEVKDAVVLQEVNCDPITQHFVTVNGDMLKEDSQYRVQGGESLHRMKRKVMEPYILRFPRG